MNKILASHEPDALKRVQSTWHDLVTWCNAEALDVSCLSPMDFARMVDA